MVPGGGGAAVGKRATAEATCLGALCSRSPRRPYVTAASSAKATPINTTRAAVLISARSQHDACQAPPYKCVPLTAKRGTPRLTAWASTPRVRAAMNLGVPCAVGARIRQKLPAKMNTDPHLVRHQVLLPPSLMPVASDQPRRAPLAQRPSWQERQRRFRQLPLGVSGAMVLLVLVALAMNRPSRRAAGALPAMSLPVAAANSISRLRPLKPVGLGAPAVATSVVPRAAEPPAVERPAPAAAPRVHAAPSVSARSRSEKIAVSESRPKTHLLGVSKPTSPSVSTSAFDAPFVPPVD